MPAPVIPQTADELAEFIVDKKRMNEVFNNEDPKVLPEFLTAYARATNKKDPELLRQLEEQNEKQFAAWAKDSGVEFRRQDMRPASAKDVKVSRQTGNAYMPEAPGKDLNGKFSGIMDFLGAVGGDPREESVRDQRKLIKNAMSSTDPSLGRRSPGSRTSRSSPVPVWVSRSARSTPPTRR